MANRLDSLELPSSTPGLQPAAVDLLNERFLLIAQRLRGLALESSGGMLQASHTERIGLTIYQAEALTAGTQFWENDRNVVYLVRTVNKAKVWAFEAGLYVDGFANRPADLALYDAGFLFYSTDRTILERWTGSGWTWLDGTMRGAHSGRPTPSSTETGMLYYETDRTVTYRWSGSAWVYQSGTMSSVQANIAGLGLGANDAGFLYWVSDYDHMLEWNGGAWVRGPGDPEHSDTFHYFGAAPTDTGWHACDGSTNVPYLKVDGTLGTRNLPNVTGGGPCYMKLASTYSESITAAAAPTFTGTPGTTGATSAGTPAGTISAINGSSFAFVGNAMSTHTHDAPVAVNGTNGYILDTGSTGGSYNGKAQWTVATGGAPYGPFSGQETGATSAGTPTGSISNSVTPTFTGAALGTHTHSFTPAGTISLAGGDPIAHFQAIPYYRQ